MPKTFDEWFRTEDYGDREQLERCWANAQLAESYWAMQRAATPPDTPVVARELFSRLITLAAAVIAGHGFISPDADDNPKTTPRAILDQAEKQREQLRRWAIEIREVADKLSAATTSPSETAVGGEARLHYPFAARHANCAECDREYEPLPPEAVEAVGIGYAPVPAAGDGEGERPRIICLCGSTRFVDTWISEYQRLSDEGNIVLTVARMPPRPNLQHDEPELKKRLDNLHLRKIDLADEVFVLNVDGYVGSSTRNEIAYAISRGKPVNYFDVHLRSGEGS